MATASLPLTNKRFCKTTSERPDDARGTATRDCPGRKWCQLFFDFPKNGDRHIRTHLGTEGAGGTGFEICFGDDGDHEPLPVDLVTHLNKAARTGGGAKRTPLAAQFIDDYFRHDWLPSCKFPARLAGGIQCNFLKLANMIKMSQTKNSA
jgi:hypothetical protein